MKINSVNAVLNHFPIQKINNSPKINNQLQCDTVSFSGKKNVNSPEWENVIEAANTGKEIYTLLTSGASKTDIANLLQTRNEKLNVIPVEKLSEYGINPGDYIAFYSSKISPQITPVESSLYLDMSARPLDNVSKMLFALDVAHEYTHYLQDKDFYQFMRDLSGGDKNYAEVVSAIGDFIYKDLDDGLIKPMTARAMEPMDMMTAIQYRQMVPREANVTKQNILLRNGLRNENVFKKGISEDYKQLAIRAFTYIVQNPEEVDTRILTTLSNLDNNALDKLYDDIEKYVRYNIKKEKEANMTEARLAKKILGTKNTINKDLYVFFFEMLESAFQ